MNDNETGTVDFTIGNPGIPEVESSPDDVTGDADELAPVALLTEDKVRSMMIATGNGLHAGLSVPGSPPEHWKWSPAELDAIVPPLTRELNKSRTIRAAAEQSDLAVVAVGIGIHAWSNFLITKALKNADVKPETRPGPADDHRPNVGFDGQRFGADGQNDPSDDPGASSGIS